MDINLKIDHELNYSFLGLKGFTMAFGSESEWGSSSTVFMFMLHGNEQIIRNCTYLLTNIRTTHTKNI